MKTEEEEETTAATGWLAVLGQYMAQFVPTHKYEPGVILMTTQQIIDELSNMCDMELNDVAVVLSTAGFLSYHERDGRHG